MDFLSWKVTIDRKPVPQPHPYIVSGGDCGGCCLTGLLNFPPEKIREIYEMAWENQDDGKINSFSMVSMQRALDNFMYRQKLIEIWIDDYVLPTAYVSTTWGMPTPWGYPGYKLEMEWTQRLRTYLEAGYVGLAEVLFSGESNITNEYKHKDTNHWILLTGARSIFISNEFGGGHWERQIRMSCSVKGNVWLKAKQFLMRYGGFKTLYIRPYPTPEIYKKLGR